MQCTRARVLVTEAKDDIDDMRVRCSGMDATVRVELPPRVFAVAYQLDGSNGRLVCFVAPEPHLGLSTFVE